MKLLVLAQTPPPLHGQSAMVQTLLDGLGASPGFVVHHVNLRLSADAADIGRWRPGKVAGILRACVSAIWLRLTEGKMALYYVPAPGKRSALYRDWLVMALCRPFFSRLILHWHASGLGEWLGRRGTAPERWLSRVLLGRAALALVLADELAADAQAFAPRQLRVVANGIHPPPRTARPGRSEEAPFEILFLGLGSQEKGLFSTLRAIRRAHERQPGAFRLTVAGGFASAADEQLFRSEAAPLGDVVRHVGFADADKKHELLSTAAVFCFPTIYPHEGQPLVLIEALAHDLPIITTRWRAIPGMLPTEHVWYVEAGEPEALADALFAARAAGPASGELRRHYEAHFTIEAHLDALRSALRLAGQTGP